MLRGASFPPKRGLKIVRGLSRNQNQPLTPAVEDQSVAIFKESLQRMVAIPFQVEIHYLHPYAHPKVPGQQRDHRDR